MTGWPGQIGVAALLAATDAASELVQLTEAEHIGAMDQQRIDRRHVQAAFDDIGGQQNIVFAIAELGHHAFEFGRRQTAVRGDDAGFRHDFREAFCHAGHVLDSWHDAEDLAAAETFALDGFADHHRIERHDEGADGKTIDWRGGDDAHLPHAG